LKKLRTMFDESDLNHLGYIYIEQVHDLLKRVFGDLLSPFLITILE